MSLQTEKSFQIEKSFQTEKSLQTEKSFSDWKGYKKPLYLTYSRDFDKAHCYFSRCPFASVAALFSISLFVLIGNFF